jgi:sugar/nucleoside kinase (ribokinase family)
MICVVGALAVDLLIRRDRFLKGTSNPASIRFSPGGVGYRIFSHLESPKMLFTALGSDMFATWLMEKVEQPRSVNPIFLDQFPTACYCALMQSGDLLYGAADMTVIERGLSWERLRARLPELGAGDFLVLEANLGPELVRSLIRHVGRKTRVVFESVSVEKLLRHAQNLRNLYLLSGNESEVRALGEWYNGGQNDRSAGGWIRDILAERQIEQLLVSRGRRGVRLYQREEGEGGTSAGSKHGRGAKWSPITIAPGRLIEMADTTGAGDRLFSAYLEQLVRQGDPAVALRGAMETVERSIEEGTL